MPHLVEPFRYVSLDECLIRLEACLKYLVTAGSEAVKRAVNVQANSDWGLRMKRTPVVLLRDGAPPDIGHTGTEHSLAEVINQTANIRRMLDVLRWIRSNESGLKNHTVEVCHPTTSSGTKDDPETDLELSYRGLPTVKIEVTDVVGNKDGNKKEATDLKKLGFISSTTKKDNKPVTPPNYRAFLVMSQELGDVIAARDSWWSHGASAVVRLEPKQSKSDTLIFEVFSISGNPGR